MSGDFARVQRRVEKQVERGTMGQNRKEYRINSHLDNHCPTSSGVSEMSERVSAVERASVASSAAQADECAVRANNRMDEQVAQSQLLAVLPHCVMFMMSFDDSLPLKMVIVVIQK